MMIRKTLQSRALYGDQASDLLNPGHCQLPAPVCAAAISTHCSHRRGYLSQGVPSIILARKSHYILTSVGAWATIVSSAQSSCHPTVLTLRDNRRFVVACERWRAIAADFRTPLAVRHAD